MVESMPFTQLTELRNNNWKTVSMGPQKKTKPDPKFRDFEPKSPNETGRKIKRGQDKVGTKYN